MSNKLFTAKVDPAKNSSQARLLRTLLLIFIVTDIAAYIAAALGGFGWQYILPMGSLLILALVGLFAFERGFLLPAQIILPASLFVVTTYILVTPPGFGLHDINILVYAVVIILASLTLGQRGAFAFSFLIILAIWIIGIAELQGRLVSPGSPLTLGVSPLVMSIVVLAITFMQRALITLLNENAQRAQVSEQELIQRNAELQALSNGLEQTVQERTSALEKRAGQLQAITALSEAIAKMQDLNEILPAVTRLISEYFGFYHVGIFLVDGARQYAILQAANSEGGRRMLQRNHRLKLGLGIVGYTAQTGIPRIALDVGADAVYFDNPDLPETRSEVALPMKSHRETIGILDVQSKQADAFSDEDLQILTTLANQVAISLENARLLTETRAALTQVQEVYDEFTRAEWSRTVAKVEQPGFRYNAGRIEMLEEPITSLQVLDAVRTGEVIIGSAHGSNQKPSTMAVPVKVRGETIGVIHIESNDPSKTWQQSDVTLVAAVAERAAFAMENARLFQDARRRAAKEQAISEATGRISSAINIENILHTTAEELERVLGGSEVLIRFQSKE